MAGKDKGVFEFLGSEEAIQIYIEIISDAAPVLAGVIVGFILSLAYNARKEQKLRNDCKKSLFDEVRFNHEITKNKIDILDQAISELKQTRFLPIKCVAYSTIEYRNLYHIALPKLTALEKDNLRHLNSFYLTIDEFLDEFDESFKNNFGRPINSELDKRIVKNMATTKLKDMKESLSKNLELSSYLLKGKPLPIFKESET